MCMCVVLCGDDVCTVYVDTPSCPSLEAPSFLLHRSHVPILSLIRQHAHTTVLLHALAHTLKQQQEKDKDINTPAIITGSIDGSDSDSSSKSGDSVSVPLPALRMSAKDINADPVRFFGGSG